MTLRFECVRMIVGGRLHAVGALEMDDYGEAEKGKHRGENTLRNKICSARYSGQENSLPSPEKQFILPVVNPLIMDSP